MESGNELRSWRWPSPLAGRHRGWCGGCMWMFAASSGGRKEPPSAPPSFPEGLRFVPTPPPPEPSHAKAPLTPASDPFRLRGAYSPHMFVSVRLFCFRWMLLFSFRCVGSRPFFFAWKHCRRALARVQPLAEAFSTGLIPFQSSFYVHIVSVLCLRIIRCWRWSNWLFFVVVFVFDAKIVSFKNFAAFVKTSLIH